MDLKNNEVGRNVGMEVRKEEDSYRRARDRCLELANTGQLWVIGTEGKEVQG